MATYTENGIEDLRGLSLCSGYGGLDLGLAIAEPGYRTVCYVEREAHAAATLVARMEDEALDQAPIWSDVRTFNGRPWRDRIHILTAGYPCQPFSLAGKRGGKNDPRHLWPEIERIISEVRPRAVFAENVEGHLNLGLPDVIGSLRRMGYDAKAGLFTAREAGARHRRRRLFILAYANSERCGLYAGRDDQCRQGRDNFTVRSARGPVLANERGTGMVNDVADDEGFGLEGDQPSSIFAPGPGELQDWENVLRERADLQPAVLRVDHGMADRVDRTRGAGNGVCPLAAALAYRTLSDAFTSGA